MQAERGQTVTMQTSSLPALWSTIRAKVIGRRFVQHVGVLTIANVGGAALSIVQGILVARWLGPELYGVAVLIMSYPSLLYTFFDARSVEASVKYLGEFHARDERNRVLAICKLGYTVDLVIALLACFVVSVTASWVSVTLVLHSGAAWLIFIYAAALLPHALVGTSYAVMATLGKFSMIAWVDTLTTTLRVVLVLCLTVSGGEVAGVVWGNAIATVIAGLAYGGIGWMLICWTWGASPLQGSWQFLRGRRREIVGFLTFNNVNALMGMIPKQVDVVLLGYFRNPTEVGYYKLAKSLTGTVGYLVTPLQWVTYPELARLRELDGQAVQQKVKHLALLVGLPLGLACLAGTLLIPVVLSRLVGELYRPSVIAAQLLLMSSAVWLAFFWIRPVYLSMGRIKVWSIAIGIYAIGFSLLSVPLTFWLGYIGMSIASTLVTVSFHIIMVVRLLFTEQKYA